MQRNTNDTNKIYTFLKFIYPFWEFIHVNSCQLAANMKNPCRKPSSAQELNVGLSCSQCESLWHPAANIQKFKNSNNDSIGGYLWSKIQILAYMWGVFVKTNVLLTKTEGVSNSLASTEYISFPVKPCSIIYCVPALLHISWCDTNTCRLVEWCKTSRKMSHVVDEHLCTKQAI